MFFPSRGLLHGVVSSLLLTFGLGLYAQELPQPYFETYEQVLTLRFDSASAAKEASLVLLPLYEGKELAVTCRWDDNWYVDNVKIGDMTQAVGIKGTFFLNDFLEKDAERFVEMGRACLDAGHSLGTHGLIHAPMSANNINYLLEEFLRDRIQIEQAFDTTVNSHAWAYMDIGNAFDCDIGTPLTAETMFRAGIIGHAQEYGAQKGSTVLCPRIGKAYNNHKDKLTPETFGAMVEQVKKSEPSVYIMPIHTQWYKDADSEVAQAASVAGNPNYWYCTMSEYAAYRNQFLRTKVESRVSGKKLNVTLTRPVLRDLNDPVPLTLEIEGCAADQLAGVDAQGVTVSRVEGGAGLRFLLPHPSDQALPVKTGAVYNDENGVALLSDPAFPGLKGVLNMNGTQLRWIVENTSSAPLTDVRLALRLPYAYEGGVQYIDVPDIAAGQQTKGDITLVAQSDDYKFYCASPFFALQVDGFFLGGGGTPVRFYLTTNGPEVPHCADYPKGNFDVLGPIPDAEWSESIVEPILKRSSSGFILADGAELSFSAEEPNPSLMEDLPSFERINDGYARYWAAEMVLTSGTVSWLAEPRYGYYILSSEVSSNSAEQVYLLMDQSVREVYLNGQRIEQEASKEGWHWQPAKANRFLLDFKARKNDLLIVVYTGKTNSYQSKQGSVLRFTTNKQTQAPYQGLQFVAPSR